MNIVILTVDHLYANKVVKDVVTALGSEIKLIVESETLLPKKSKLQALRRYLSVSGFRYVVIQVLKLQIYKALSIVTTKFSQNNSKFYSYRPIAVNLKIKLTKTKNVNEKVFISKLKKSNPDLIISIFFNQILSGEIIRIPRKGIINIHPGYLPAYRGVSPVFWALVNSEKYAGISIHYINQGIDTGKIIERKKVKVDNEDTEDSLYWKLCEIGAPLLTKTIQDIKLGKVKTINNTGGRYFSLPSKEAVKRYGRKHKFFTLWGYIFA